jgi:hypothetical protein
MQITIRPAEIPNLYAPVPDGLYQVRIAEFEENEGAKGPWAKVNMMICEGEFAETRMLTDNWMFMDSALWRTLEKLSAFAGHDISEDEEFAFDSDEFIGLEANVMTSQGTYPIKDPKPGGPTEAVKSEITAYYPVSDSPVGTTI